MEYLFPHYLHKCHINIVFSGEYFHWAFVFDLLNSEHSWLANVLLYKMFYLLRSSHLICSDHWSFYLGVYMQLYQIKEYSIEGVFVLHRLVSRITICMLENLIL